MSIGASAMPGAARIDRDPGAGDEDGFILRVERLVTALSTMKRRQGWN
jgi:hypothetical protein